MTFDSATLCARTTAGEAELATPSQGLSLGQRRVLTLLQNPSAVDELAQKYRLEPEKLARDLTRLADLKLIQLHGPTTIAPAPAAPAAAPADTSMAPVVIGRSTRRSAALPLFAGVAVIVLSVGLWYGTRTREPAGADSPPTAQAPAASASKIGSAPAPAPVVAPVTSDAAPAIATILRGNAAPAEFRPDIRPGLIPAAANARTTNVAPAPKPAEPGTAPTPEPSPRVVAVAAPAAVAPPTPAPSAPTIAAPAAPAAPAPSSPTIAKPEEHPPSVQLAAAAPTATPARPAIVTELKPISRDAPDFPREAIAAGITKGVVSARIHVDASGKVTAVDILGGQPQHVFDRAVRNALSRWQFEPIAAARTSDVEINFQRE
jgi:protein TonB